MNSSTKVAFLGTVTLIVGIYSVSLKDVQKSRIETGLANINRVQYRFSADAAMRSALSLYQYYDGKNSVSGTKALPNGNGVFDYAITKVTGKTTVAVTITYPDGSTQFLSGLVEKVPPGQAVKSGSRKIHKGYFQLTDYYAGSVKKPKK